MFGCVCGVCQLTIWCGTMLIQTSEFNPRSFTLCVLCVCVHECHASVCVCACARAYHDDVANQSSVGRDHLAISVCILNACPVCPIQLNPPFLHSKSVNVRAIIWTTSLPWACSTCTGWVYISERVKKKYMYTLHAQQTTTWLTVTITDRHRVADRLSLPLTYVPTSRRSTRLPWLSQKTGGTPCKNS